MLGPVLFAQLPERGIDGRSDVFSAEAGDISQEDARMRLEGRQRWRFLEHLKERAGLIATLLVVYLILGIAHYLVGIFCNLLGRRG